jgi:hypothetical protein
MVEDGYELAITAGTRRWAWYLVKRKGKPVKVLQSGHMYSYLARFSFQLQEDVGKT